MLMGVRFPLPPDHSADRHGLASICFELAVLEERLSDRLIGKVQIRGASGRIVVPIALRGSCHPP